MDAPAELSDLIVAARRGRPDALGRIFEAARAMLMELAERELPPALRAKLGASDLVQETAADMQRDFAAFAGTTPEECFAWLRAILKHNVVDAVRGYQQSQKRDVGRETSLASRSTARHVKTRLLSDRVPADSAIRREEAAVIEAAIERLPEEYRRALRLRYWLGMSFADMAAELDRSPNTARMIWFRAVGQLQVELRAAGLSPGSVSTV